MYCSVVFGIQFGLVDIEETSPVGLFSLTVTFMNMRSHVEGVDDILRHFKAAKGQVTESICVSTSTSKCNSPLHQLRIFFNANIYRQSSIQRAD